MGTRSKEKRRGEKRSSRSGKGNVTGSPGGVVVLYFISNSCCRAAEKACGKKGTRDKMVGKRDKWGEEGITRAGGSDGQHTMG